MSPERERELPGARRRRRAVLACVALAVVAVAVFAGAWLRERRVLRAAFPTFEGRYEVPGLQQTLTIVRDERGVPHIRARSRRDAYFGLGFAHAQDRLAQMVWLVRAARGRLAEVLGPRALDADRLARTLGLGRLADREAERLDPTARALFEAYAAGVNARIERIRAGSVAPPRPLSRHDVPLEEWTVADSLAISKLHAWGLDGSLEVSLVLSDLIEHLGGFEARPFFPSGAADTLVPLPRRRPVQARAPAGPRARNDGGIVGLVSLQRAVALRGGSVGSSAWIVSGKRSASGRPLLAADVHLEPTTPPLLYEAHLRAGERDLVGIGVPGLPIFWNGHNGHVAWASTHARAVVLDLYKETLDPDDPSRYRNESRWSALEQREEEIRVRGARPYRLLVRETRHGPLLDEGIGAKRGPLAVAWTGARAGSGLHAFLKASQAKNAEAFRAALEEHASPALAVVYADGEGAGGLQVAGWIPHRAMATSLVAVPGRTRWYDWRGRIPFEQLPHVALDPDVDWLIAADNPLGDPKPPYTIEWLWRTGERARRIDALLRRAASEGPIDTGRLAQAQQDVRSPESSTRARLALELAGPIEELPREAAEAARLLRAWDGSTAVNSAGAAVYNLFLVQLVKDLLTEQLGESLLASYVTLRGAGVEALVGQLLEVAFDPRQAAGGLVEPTEVRAAVRASLRKAGLELLVRLGTNRKKWGWGRLHRLRFRPFGWSQGSRAAWLGGEPGTDFAIPYPGDRLTVSVAEYDLARPFEARVVSLSRFALDLADPEVALSMLAPGTSEHAGHPHRTGELAAWLAGEPRLLVSQPLLIEESAGARLRLDPLRDR